MEDSLLKSLIEYQEKDICPMHMPGHKRRLLPEYLRSTGSIDISEIEGFDDLHDAKGIIAGAQKRTADLYGSDETLFLVNGSSGGILAAITALCAGEGRLIMGRSSHRSAYHAVEINRIKPLYIYPEVNSVYGIDEGISAQALEDITEEEWQKVSAIYITSPTYDGNLSDIRGICEIAHAHGLPAIVDEAHGAHLRFSDYFPESAVEAGADVVVQSAHKTLPAFTQSSFMHINGQLVDRERLHRMLKVFQSSSPSYILMAGLDECSILLKERGNELYKAYTERLDSCRERLGTMKKLHLFGPEDIEHRQGRAYDRSKILVSTVGSDIGGGELYRMLLEEYRIQMDMESGDYVLGISSVADGEEGFKRLEEALLDIDDKVGKREPAGIDREIPRCEAAMSIYEAGLREKNKVPLESSEGKICGEYVYLYPPGVPIIAPGEIINRAVLECISRLSRSGMSLKGVKNGGIAVVII